MAVLRLFENQDVSDSILACLSSPSVGNLSGCCRFLHHVARDDRVWERRFVAELANGHPLRPLPSEAHLSPYQHVRRS